MGKLWRSKNRNKVNAYGRMWYRKNKEKHIQRVKGYKHRAAPIRTHLLRSIKASNPCTDCHKYFHYVSMDFDHVCGRKRMTLSSARLSAEETTLEEIRKCQLVCANCHRVRTFNMTRGWSNGGSSVS